MENKINLTLEMDNENINNAITFKELYESILQEIEDYKKLDMLDELMNQKIIMNMTDLNGNVVYGYSTLFVGWLESGNVLITGALNDVYEQK